MASSFLFNKYTHISTDAIVELPNFPSHRRQSGRDLTAYSAGTMSSGRYMAYSPSPSTAPHSPHIAGLRSATSALVEQEKYASSPFSVFFPHNYWMEICVIRLFYLNRLVCGFFFCVFGFFCFGIFGESLRNLDFLSL